MKSPFTITVWDKSFIRQGWIGAPLEVELHPRHNQQPTGTIRVASNGTYVGKLLAQGARVTVDYDGEQIMSGPVRTLSGEAVPDASVLVGIEDDWRILTRLLAWPSPTHDINAQGDEKAFDTKTGPAETVVKWFISRNATRLGLPVTIATDHARGDTITVSLRMMPPADRLLPLLDQAGIGVSVRQVGAQLVVDCYAVNTVSRVLTTSSGVVRAAEWDLAGASATRVIVGGGGFRTDRDFRHYINTALEAATGDVIETFIDAEDAYSDADRALSAWLDAVKDEREKAHDLAVATKDLHKANAAYTAADLAYNIAQNAYDDGHTSAKASTLTAAANASNNAQDDKNSAQDDYDAAVTAHNAAVALSASTFATLGVERTAYYAELDRRGAEALAAGAPLAGLKLTLAETDTFRYGRTVRVGDLVTTAVIPGATPITDVLREAVLAWNTNDGFIVTPVVGDRSDDPNKSFARAVASLFRQVRNLKARS